METLEVLFGSVIFVVVFFGLYFLPSFIAFRLEHSNKTAILALNIFLGWTVLGWVGSLVWSLTNQER